MVDRLYGHFSEYALKENGDNLCVPYQNVSEGRFIRLGLENPLNGIMGECDSPILQYKIGQTKLDIFCVGEFEKIAKTVTQYIREREVNPGEYSLAGRLAEKISWNLLKYNLTSLEGVIVGDEYQEGNILKESGDYILKVVDSPNVKLFEKKRRGEVQHKKEFDGFFRFRAADEEYIIMLETKVKGVRVKVDEWNQKAFMPLRSLYPDSKLIFVYFSDRQSILKGQTLKQNKKHQYALKDTPKTLANNLISLDVAPIFFYYPHTKRTFENQKLHILKQYKILRETDIDLSDLEVTLKTTLRGYRFTVKSGSRPIVILQRVSPGIWHELPINR